jgi:hypothetical protein
MKKSKVWLALIVAVMLLGTIAVGVALADNASPTAGQSGQNTYQAFLSNLASALNINQATLVNALKTAGVQTVNQEVQNGQITQQRANKILSQINSGKPFCFMGMGFGGKGSVAGSVYGKRQQRGGAMGGSMLMKPLASALGVSPQTLMSDLRSGQTISSLLPQGTTITQLETTILAGIQSQLNQTVTSGKMTQAQETKIYSKMQQNIESGNWITQLQNMPKRQGHHQSSSQTSQTASTT